MEGDKFINTTKNSFQHHNSIVNDENFFVQLDNKTSVNNNLLQSEPLRHINDYDANILKEDAYKEVSDEIFKLEYKIAKIENELKEIGKQIQTANEIYDYYLVDSLNTRKLQLEEDLKILTEIYKEASISAKISGGYTIKIKEKLINFGNYFISFTEQILSKISNKFSNVQEVKNSLTKLESINKSVDELMNCQYPYGEAEYRYEQLSRYIARANSIQTDISKIIK